MTTLIRIGGWAVMVAALLFANVAIADHQEVCFERYDQPADGMNRTEAFNQCKAEAEITLERFKAANPDIFSPYAVVEIYKEQTATWITPLVEIATQIFWTLAAVGMVWQFVPLAIKASDLGEFAIEFLKYIIVIGFGHGCYKTPLFSSILSRVSRIRRQSLAGAGAGLNAWQRWARQWFCKL